MKSGSLLLFLNDRYYFLWRDGERISCELGIKSLNALLFLIITMLLGRCYYYSYFSVEEMKAQRG